MDHSRRSFIRSASIVGAAAALPGWAFATSHAPRPLRILILGGTGFIGPHEIKHALSRGHKVTMFNRGKTAPDMFPDVETLIGDRDDQLDALKGRDWDAVIDNSGFYPRHARLSAELLHGHVGKYMFVSSISAYAETLTVEDDEFTAAYAVMDDPTDESEPPYGPSYGARKALCEQEVARVFGDDAINIRPGIITGTGDPTERLRHWLLRMQAGNEILVPGEEDLPVQYIDAADMCGWMVRLLEDGNGSGPYNATTEHGTVTGTGGRGHRLGIDTHLGTVGVDTGQHLRRAALRALVRSGTDTFHAGQQRPGDGRRFDVPAHRRHREGHDRGTRPGLRPEMGPGRVRSGAGGRAVGQVARGAGLVKIGRWCARNQGGDFQ